MDVPEKPLSIGYLPERPDRMGPSQTRYIPPINHRTVVNGIIYQAEQNKKRDAEKQDMDNAEINDGHLFTAFDCFGVSIVRVKATDREAARIAIRAILEEEKRYDAIRLWKAGGESIFES